MVAPYEWQVGWRYTRAGRTGRRNGFISFISFISVLGIALGVAALIIVLSVMNGFQKDVRDRMLSVIAHVELFDGRGQGLEDWRALAGRARAVRPDQVIGAAPFVASQSLIARGDTLRGALVRGISPDDEASVTVIGKKLRDTAFATLQPGRWNVVLGDKLAGLLGVRVGDQVTILTPSGESTVAGVMPRLKQFTVSGTFESGHYDYDSNYALIHIEDAQRLFRVAGPTGVQLRLAEQQSAREVAAALGASLGQDIIVSDWTRTNRNWYDAVQLEKRMMAIILTLIVAVAAFNLVSMLVMTVTDKQSDIAILRTLGASPRSIMSIFMIQGATAGIIGTLAGVALGLLIAFNLGTIVPFLEKIFATSFLPANIYIISNMPSDPQWGDIVPIALVSLMLAFVATIYPSWRASRINPAAALRYE
jgi:lipoprotein-releasing system permease protein